jgi:hypothetical protein
LKAAAATLTLVLVDSLGELVDDGRDLESLHENTLLSLDSDVLGPLHEAGQVALGLDVATEAEVAGVLLEKRSGSSDGAALGLNDLLSLSFLHLSREKPNEQRSPPWDQTGTREGVSLSALLTIMIDIYYLINNKLEPP